MINYQKTKIHPVAGEGRSSTKVVFPESENPSGWRKPPFPYETCITGEQKPIQFSETAVPVPKLHHHGTKSIFVPETANGRSNLAETAVPVLNLRYQKTKTYPVAGRLYTTRERNSLPIGGDRHAGEGLEEV